MTPRVGTVAIVVLMALAFTSLCPSPASAGVSVSVDDFVFTPANIVIPVGETVTWTVIGGFHSTTSGLDSNDPNAGSIWDSDWMFPGGQEVYSHTFADPGVFPYFCRVHDGLNMKGTIRVGRTHVAARFKGADGTEPADEIEPKSWGMIKAIYR